MLIASSSILFLNKIYVGIAKPYMYLSVREVQNQLLS